MQDVQIYPPRMGERARERLFLLQGTLAQIDAACSPRVHEKLHEGWRAGKMRKLNRQKESRVHRNAPSRGTRRHATTRCHTTPMRTHNCKY
eukprot:278377-Pleurochrysis_carterae.AAC.2